MNQLFRAIAILVGTTIGAGIFGIPFVVAKIGLIPGLIYLLILGGLILFLNLIYGEVILKTPGDHQLTGYSRLYLGRKGKVLATISLLIGLYGALWAYLIKIGEFGALLAGGNAITFSLLFFILATAAIFFGLHAVSFIEGLIFFLLLGLIGVLVVLGFSKINPANFSGVDFKYIFFPYGVILFALTGSSVIPEMEEILRNRHKNLKKAIIIGSLIPLFIYLLFTVVIVGICGPLTADDAISGLVKFLPISVVDLGAVLGILSMGSSFLTLGFVLREVWFRDFGLKKPLAFVLACLPPLLMFLFARQSFISVLGASGAVSGGLTAILIIACFLKIKKQSQQKADYSLHLPQGLIWLLFLVFILGMLTPFI